MHFQLIVRDRRVLAKENIILHGVSVPHTSVVTPLGEDGRKMKGGLGRYVGHHRDPMAMGDTVAFDVSTGP